MLLLKMHLAFLLSGGLGNAPVLLTGSEQGLEQNKDSTLLFLVCREAIREEEVASPPVLSLPLLSSALHSSSKSRVVPLLAICVGLEVLA